MEILYIALLTILASAVGTMSGFGTSTIMIPILMFFFPPLESIFLVAIIHWFGNVWKVTLFRTGFNLQFILLFGLAGLLASLVGAFLSLGANQEMLLRILGGFLVPYAIFLLYRNKFKIPIGKSAALAGGLFSGFFAGLFGIGGAIRSMFLTAFDLPKAAFIATAGAIGLLIDTTRIITYFAGGAELSQNLWLGLLLFIPASFLGAAGAKRIVERIPQQKFRFVVAVFLFATGLKFLVWP